MINISTILDCAALCLANRTNNRKTNVPIVEGYFVCWRGLSLILLNYVTREANFSLSFLSRSLYVIQR